MNCIKIDYARKKYRKYFALYVAVVFSLVYIV